MKTTRQAAAAALLMTVALVLGACSSRSNAADCLDGVKDLEGQVAAPNQSAKQGDRSAGAAIREGGEGDNTQATSDTGVDVQAQNQNSGTQVQYAPLVGDAKAAAAALTTTTPGEAHVIELLRDSRKRKVRLEGQLDATPGSEAGELERIRGELAAVARSESSLVERLEAYAERKFKLAQSLAPDLSSLVSVVQLVVNPQGIGGMEYPMISDEQAKAIGSVAGKSVEGVARMLGGDKPDEGEGE